MLQFLETIHLRDGRFYHLDWHQHRVNKVFKKFFASALQFELKKLLSRVIYPRQGLFRVRIVYDVIVQQISFIPYTPKHIDFLKIESGNFDYSHKYEDRSVFADSGENWDYLYHKEGCVKETSIANIAFFDGRRWETPILPYLKGTTRERYVNSGWLYEKEITIAQIQKYEKVAFMNAMLGFVVLGHVKEIIKG